MISEGSLLQKTDCLSNERKKQSISAAVVILCCVVQIVCSKLLLLVVRRASVKTQAESERSDAREREKESKSETSRQLMDVHDTRSTTSDFSQAVGNEKKLLNKRPSNY